MQFMDVDKLTFEEARRILAIVFTRGTVLKPSTFNPNMVVLQNGLTGRDVCEHTALQCFRALLDEEDSANHCTVRSSHGV